MTTTTHCKRIDNDNVFTTQRNTTTCNATTTHCKTKQGNMKTIEFIDNKLYRTIKTNNGFITYEKEHKEINLIPRFRIRRKGQQESVSILFNNNNNKG